MIFLIWHFNSVSQKELKGIKYKITQKYQIGCITKKMEEEEKEHKKSMLECAE